MPYGLLFLFALAFVYIVRRVALWLADGYIEDGEL